MNDPKIIKVNVFASSNLEEVKCVVSDLLLQLNRSFRLQGIEFALADPCDEGTGDMAIALYWKDFGDLPQQKFESAYESLKAGNNPQKIYVFFKESSEGLEEAMQAFKDAFDKKYGHFYCVFEHLDSIKFELATQCLSYLPKNGNEQISINDDGNVELFGEHIANIENLPFAKFNSKRKSLLRQISKGEEEVEELKSESDESPNDEDLQETLRDAIEKLHDLKEELTKYDDLLFTRALYFARESVKEMDERVAKSRELFNKGKMSEANKVFDRQEMKRDEERFKQIKAANDQAFERLIQEYNTAAQVVMLDESLNIKERFVQACEDYENVIRIAHEISYLKEDLGEMMLEYARLLEDFNEFDRAERIYKLTIIIYSKLDNEGTDKYADDIARLFNFLAVLYTKLNRFSEAEGAYKKGLEIVSKLAEKESAYIVRVCQTLTNLSMLHTTLKKFEEAEQEVITALEGMRRINEIAPGLFIKDIAHSLHNLATIYLKLRKFDLAEKALKEAVNIKRDLFKKFPEEYAVDFSFSLNNLAYLHEEIGKLNEAECEYTEVVNTLETLEGRNAISAEALLATALQNLSLVNAKLGKYTDAKQEMDRAIDIYRCLVDNNPNPYKSDLARSLHNRSMILRDIGRLSEAEKDEETSLAYYSELIVNNPDIYLEYYAMGLTSLAEIHVELNQVEKALHEFELGLVYLRKLDKTNPGTYSKKIADTIGDLVNLKRQIGNLDKIEDLMVERISIYESLFDKDSNSCKDELAFSLLDLAYFHFVNKKFDDAEKEWGEGLSILRKIVEQNPCLYDYQACIAISMIKLGDISLACERFNEAEERYLETLAIYRKLAAISPDVYDSDVASILNTLANLHRDINKLEEAESEYEEALCIYKRLSENNPGLYDENISEIKTALFFYQKNKT